MKTTAARLALAALLLVLAVAAGLTWVLRLVTVEGHTGYFGPAFSLDGRFVYAIVRETTGLTWGASMVTPGRLSRAIRRGRWG
ncbi:MAG TPA: hypothetical protein VGX21_07315 [Methylomirabilota bacterium]|nr:hypothetical protein [Methylomirabilota bacterium]